MMVIYDYKDLIFKDCTEHLNVKNNVVRKL